METLQQLLEYPIWNYQNYKLTPFSLISLLVIYFFARLSLWGITQAINRNLEKKGKEDSGRRHAIIQIAKYLIYTFAVIFAMQSVGLDLSIVVAGSAALMVGIGFGLQNTFNDFISGIIILFDGSIQVGDIMQVDSLVGKIKRIGIRATTIDTRDAIAVIIPNSKFTQENVINWSHEHEMTRFSVKVGVAYGSDVPLVMETLQEAAEQHISVIKDPKPKVRFLDFGDSALLFEVLFWTRDTFNVEFIKSDIRVAIDKAFRTNHIQIPFPQRDLHIVSDQRIAKPN